MYCHQLLIKYFDSNITKMVCFRLEPVFSDLNQMDMLTSPDDIRSMWKIITKAKDCITSGYRLENLSWRLWYSATHAEKTKSHVSPISPPFSEKEPEFCLDDEFVEIDSSLNEKPKRRSKSPISISHIVEEICNNEPKLEDLKRVVKYPKTEKTESLLCEPASIKQYEEFNAVKLEDSLVDSIPFGERRESSVTKTSRSFVTINSCRSLRHAKKSSRKSLDKAFAPEVESDEESDKFPPSNEFSKDLETPTPSLPPHRKSLLSLLLSNNTTPHLSSPQQPQFTPPSASPIETSQILSNSLDRPKFSESSSTLPDFSSPFMIW